MTLESQVTSLALSQRLKELGVKQESLFLWKKDNPLGANDTEPYIVLHNSRYAVSGGNVLCSAFTSSELGELLPKGVLLKLDTPTNLIIRKYDGKWSVQYLPTVESNMSVLVTESVSLADAMAKILIYLLENKLITI